MCALKGNRTKMAGTIAIAGILAVSVFGLAVAKAQHRSAICCLVDGQTVQQAPGFYCNLKSLTPEERERHHQLTEEIAQAKMETKELADGYAFRLEAGKVSLGDLADWVSAERKCCPFFDFEISVGRDGGPLWLKLRGAEGVKEFMRREFRIL